MTPILAGAKSYSMAVVCSNCGHRSMGYWPKGLKATTTTCDYCGCMTAVPVKRS
jgi:ribosomal protein S27E